MGGSRIRGKRLSADVSTGVVLMSWPMVASELNPLFRYPNAHQRQLLVGVIFS